MIPKRILDEDKVALEIDLKKLFGANVTSKSLRESIAEDLIAVIEKRTASGGGVNGKGQEVELQAPYSEEYAGSLDFKAFNKKKNKVNMKLTGSMLASLDLIDEQGSKITIGIDNEEAPKAHGHMTGADGRLPVRPFLGLTADDLEDVRKEYEDQVLEPKIKFKDLIKADDLASVLRSFRRNKGFGFEK